MKLIMNADDYGFSRSINFGIIDAFNEGIVRSTTIMANMPGFSHAVELSKENPSLGIGIHLVLTCGEALTGINKTITDENGSFFSLGDLTEKVSQIDLAEVEKEYTAQIERVLSCGIIPTHLDSHHHTHTLSGIYNVFLKMAHKYNLPIRLFQRDDLPADFKHIKSPDTCSVDFFNNGGIEFLIDLIEKYKDSNTILEIMCHPAYLDQAILTGSSYNIQRTKELEVLRSKEIIEYIKVNDIELITFKEI